MLHYWHLQPFSCSATTMHAFELPVMYQSQDCYVASVKETGGWGYSATSAGSTSTPLHKLTSSYQYTVSAVSIDTHAHTIRDNGYHHKIFIYYLSAIVYLVRIVH